MNRGIRVYELARELDVSSKDILQLLAQQMNIELNNHMSTVNDQVAAKVRRLVQQIKEIQTGVDSEPKAAGKAQGASRPSSEASATQAVSAPKQAARPARSLAPEPHASADDRPALRPRPAGAGPQPVPTSSVGRPSPVGRPRPAGAERGGSRPLPPSARPMPTAAGAISLPGRSRPGAGQRPSGSGAAATVPAAGAATASRPPRAKKGKGRQREQIPLEAKESASALAKLQRRKRSARRERQETGPQLASELRVRGPMIVAELAEALGVSAMEVMRHLVSKGTMATINQQVDVAVIKDVAEAVGVPVIDETAEREESSVNRETISAILAQEDAEHLTTRPPVVAVLGHVDHGKTSLLDAIRSTNVASGEAGGITQHIGASTVQHDGKTIVFIDTPGHEAFTSMRARGAQVTDIAVLVVAADDGIMPQTEEAIAHIRAAKVPMVVALNKIDRPNANPDRVKQQLAERGLVPEDWGGDTIVVPVSAIKRQGIDTLLEMILLVAEIEDLKADPTRPAAGTVIEAQLDRGRGPVATILVQTGTLRRGDNFVAGVTSGRVRAMVNDRGETVDAAGPATPVSVLGFDQVPSAGDLFEVVPDEKTARERVEARSQEQRAEEMQRRGVSLAEFYQQAEHSGDRDLLLVVKTDVQGALEAFRASLEKLPQDDVRITVIHSGVGAINESDVMLAAASGAIIIGFNVRPDTKARVEAERVGVDIRTYRIIYEALDDIQAAMRGRLAPEFKEVVMGRAEVRQTFKVPNVGIVAGCYVTEGKIARSSKIRLLRNGVVVYDGEVDTLKRFKDDVREVAAGYECGLSLERFQDIKEGDVVEAYRMEEIARD